MANDYISFAILDVHAVGTGPTWSDLAIFSTHLPSNSHQMNFLCHGAGEKGKELSLCYAPLCDVCSLVLPCDLGQRPPRRPRCGSGRCLLSLAECGKIRDTGRRPEWGPETGTPWRQLNRVASGSAPPSEAQAARAAQSHTNYFGHAVAAKGELVKKSLG